MGSAAVAVPAAPKIAIQRNDITPVETFMFFPPLLFDC
ncbi:hypothetical protein H206_05369 [Candidatus Electrothrix aarhusensis]|uniref:Uncharacterized protein n=1 Tax=Candidatus Electrothrix aarhusensis TaxID=1859131 RepID=A0A3S3QLW0_9BACT|nr:hypothetical protein H206_05369 [Candidatus Electrothrix aarhusensis]